MTQEAQPPIPAIACAVRIRFAVPDPSQELRIRLIPQLDNLFQPHRVPYLASALPQDCASISLQDDANFQLSGRNMWNRAIAFGLFAQAPDLTTFEAVVCLRQHNAAKHTLIDSINIRSFVGHWTTQLWSS